MTVGQRATLVIAAATAGSAFAGVICLATHLPRIWLVMAASFAGAFILASLQTSDRRQP